MPEGPSPRPHPQPLRPRRWQHLTRPKSRRRPVRAAPLSIGRQIRNRRMAVQNGVHLSHAGARLTTDDFNCRLARAHRDDGWLVARAVCAAAKPPVRHENPLSVRLALGVLAVLSLVLLVQAAMDNRGFVSGQMGNQAVCSVLLLAAAATGAFDVYRSPAICTACALVGLWLALSSCVLAPAPSLAAAAVGIAIFFLAGYAADDLSQVDESGQEE